MAEKEETSAPSRTLASLENLLAVGVRAQGSFQNLVVIEVLLESLHHELALVKRNSHI